MTPLPSSRLLLLILSLLTTLGIFSTSIYLPSLPAIGRTLNASQESVQLTLAVFFIGSAVGSLLLGPVADRMGRLIVAKGGLILFILTSLWCAQSQNILSLQWGRFFQGIAASSGSLVAQAVGRDLYEGPHLTRFSSTILMVMSLSPAIAPTVGGIIEAYLGWEKNFYFLMLFGGIIFLLVWIWLPETHDYRKSREHSPVLKSYFSLLKDPYYSFLCFITGLQMTFVMCYVALSPYLFINFFKWSVQEYGLMGIVSAFGNIAGFGFARHMAHRLHFHQGILIGASTCLLMTLFFIGFCFFIPLRSYLLIIYILFFMGASALTTVNASSAAMTLYPHKAGISSAIIGAAQIGSGAIGSVIASSLSVSPCVLAMALGGLSVLSLTSGILIEKKKWLGR